MAGSICCIDVEQMFYNKRSKIRGDVWSSLTDSTDAGDYRIVNRWFVVRGMDN